MYSYRLKGQGNKIHKGSNNNEKHGEYRQLLRKLVDNELINALVIVFRW